MVITSVFETGIQGSIPCRRIALGTALKGSQGKLLRLHMGMFVFANRIQSAGHHLKLSRQGAAARSTGGDLRSLGRKPHTGSNPVLAIFFSPIRKWYSGWS